MASTNNTSSSPNRNSYDVFVSFRGKDTRLNFAGHLFAALQRKCISVFRDDKLKKGESIAPELLHAIEDSKIFVVIFSKNYASSTWCLRELEHILECVKLSGKRVLPVFCDVDPTEVRHQKGFYGEAFANHEKRFQQHSPTVPRWREALTQVANLSGWDLRDKSQYEEIEKIVKEIIIILDYEFSSLSKDLVGMHSLMHELEKYLCLDSLDGVRVVGICGMGGIGKTTLATALYNKISHQFPVHCLIDDLSKIYRDNPQTGVPKQILLKTLGKEQLPTCDSYDPSNLMRSRLRRVKALIILDNVGHVKQLEELSESRDWLGAGSRIIVISRDEHILNAHKVDFVYKVPLLSQADSVKLFSRKAFNFDHIETGYEDVALKILHYANGLPLAIKTLGSLLSGRDISQCKSALARLRESPKEDIMDVLRLSFEGLEDSEQKIFLDIACFFCWREEDYVRNVLNCCGFHADIGLRVLIEKSLICISKENRIVMHNLLEELGIKIAQENSSKESRKWSRLWLHKQLPDVMLENAEKKVEGICFLRDTGERKEILVMAETLSKMSHLRLLILTNVKFSGTINRLSNELKYVEWKNYPYKYLPSGFQPYQLVELILRYSNVRQLWEDQHLPNLRTLDLSYSKNLRKTPNFREMPNLEWISFEGCVKLLEIDPSIGLLRKLVFLNLKDCKKLVSIPNNVFRISSLEILILYGCPKVYENISHLNISESASHSQSTTSSILKWTMFRFRSLYPDAHKYFASSLLPPLRSLSSLIKLDISFCGLSQIPDAFECLRWLEELNLGGNNFVTLPILKGLSRLAYLNLEHCKQLESLPQLPFPTAIKHNLPKFKYCKRIGLIIFNCLKLEERERCSSMAISWMLQLVKARQHAFFDKINIVIPKSEIPSGINYQKSMSNSIPIELSPFMHDKDKNDRNIIGIACCAVFSIAPLDPSETRYEIELSIFNNSTRYGWCELFDNIPVNVERDPIAVKSDHTWLIIFSRDSFFDILNRLDENLKHLDHFSVKVESENCKVQSCGYDWIYKQDLQVEHLDNFITKVEENCEVNDYDWMEGADFLHLFDETQYDYIQ